MLRTAPPRDTIASVLCRLPPALLPCALALAVGTPARAQEAGPHVLIVRATPAGSPTARQIADELSIELTARGWSVREPEPLSVEQVSEAEALREARAAYAGLRLAEAGSLIHDVIDRADRSGGAGLTRSDLIETLLLGAMVARATGDRDAEAAALDRALAVFPGLEPDPIEYPPTLVDEVAARRAEARSELTAPIRIDSLPPDARVWIDCEETTRVDGGRLELPVGQHLIRITAPRHHALGSRIAVDSEEILPPMRLEPDPEAVLRDPGPPGTPVAELVEAARLLGSTLLLVDVRRHENRWVVAARLPGAGRSARTSVAGPTDARAAARALAAGLGAGPAEPTPDDGDGNKLVWIVAGGVAAAAIATGVLLIVLGAREGDPQGWLGQGGF